jgi:hypothetical protein
VNAFFEFENVCRCPHEGFSDPNAGTILRFYPQGLAQVTWSSPISNKVLFEAIGSVVFSTYTGQLGPEATPDTIAITNIANGFTYSGSAGYGGTSMDQRWGQRLSVSYVTGSHAVKVGTLTEQLVLDSPNSLDHKIGFLGESFGNISYRFLNDVPNGITQNASPSLSMSRVQEFDLYAQDQWTLKRLTLNLGAQSVFYHGNVPAYSLPAGAYVPARNFSAVADVPKWTDVNVRLGGAYDLFGDGRTALKTYFGRYVNQTATSITASSNPSATSVSSVTRSWNDNTFPVGDSRRGNFSPDCDLTNPLQNGECGTISNLNFGLANPNATRYDDRVLRGFGVRPASWEITAEVQHQLLPRLSLNGGYYHTKLFNFTATKNTLTTPADFSQYCVSAPVDPRLPSGGGYSVCGLADVSPAKFGLVSNLIVQAETLGAQKQYSDFVAAGFNVQAGPGVLFGGGIDTGQSVTDKCFIVNSIQDLVNCRTVTAFANQTRLKLHGASPLPGGLSLSGTFQSLPGPEYEANYSAPNTAIVPSLGRNLSACGAAITCTQTAVVPLIAPNTYYEDRRTQTDLRLSRVLKFRAPRRLQLNLDLYNAFNSGALLSVVSTYPTSWRTPSANANNALTNTGSGILVGRLLEFSGQLTF